MRRDEILIAKMDQVNRLRSLTETEVDQLAAAIQREKQRDRKLRQNPNMRCNWTPDEDDILRRERRSGTPIPAIAPMVGRTVNAIHARMRTMPNPPPSKQELMRQ